MITCSQVTKETGSQLLLSSLLVDLSFLLVIYRTSIQFSNNRSNLLLFIYYPHFPHIWDNRFAHQSWLSFTAPSKFLITGQLLHAWGYLCLPSLGMEANNQPVSKRCLSIYVMESLLPTEPAWGWDEVQRCILKLYFWKGQGRAEWSTGAVCWIAIKIDTVSTTLPGSSTAKPVY